jgi:hypothetical protein
MHRKLLILAPALGLILLLGACNGGTGEGTADPGTEPIETVPGATGTNEAEGTGAGTNEGLGGSDTSGVGESQTVPPPSPAPTAP